MFEILNSKYLFIFMVILLILLLGAMFVFLRKSNKGIKDGLYKQKPIMTKNEQDCFRHLMKEFPDYLISTQVSMGAILEPKIDGYSSDPNIRSEAAILRNKIGSKIIDFVLINKDTLNVEFIIELDDKSHDAKKVQDEIRDEHLALAGIYSVRFRRENGGFASRSTILKQLKEKRI